MAKLGKNHTSQTLVDQNGIEVLVGFNYDYDHGHLEECHGHHVIGNGYDIELTSVEIVIAGIGIDILPQLSRKQQNAIIEEIDIEEVVNA
jgi:hypothetical protein